VNEKEIPTQPVLPSKKQRELLDFIEAFIAKNGYSPSYREIMSGLNYSSVATVAVHVNNLIKRGHIRKRDHSARSLELVSGGKPTKITSNQVMPGEEKWLIEKIEHIFAQTESLGAENLEASLDHLNILVGALKVLGLEGAAQSFTPRLNALKNQRPQ